MTTPKISVVVATYNRPKLLGRLIEQLGRQTLDAREFELVVVDDGSREDLRSHFNREKTAFSFTLVRQANQGAASARHHGATLAKGDVLLFTDDDMQVAPALLEEHLAMHALHPHAVVLGCVRNDDSVRMPVFERFHAKMIDLESEKFRRGARPHGGNLFTGNASMRRADYFAVGGFDRSLGNSEDVELGFRLEKMGAKFFFCDAGYTIHGSDHASLEKWLARAFRYGRLDKKIARKHPELPHASPWRFLKMVNPISRPFLVFSLVAPAPAKHAARAVMGAAIAVDRLGAEKLGVQATTLAYGMEYFRGLRDDLGTLGEAMRDYGNDLSRHRRGVLGALARFVDAVRTDHKSLTDFRTKYVHETPSSWAKDAVEKVGVQIMIGVRLMRFFAEANAGVAAKLTSRMIRFLYGSDVHWDAQIGEGVALVHGFGLAVSRSAKVGPRCILFHNVTLGESIDPVTRVVGAPRLEADVHVGPGATLLGPIVVGAGSKIMAGCVLTQSVPAGSLVEAPPPSITIRPRKPTKTGTNE